jgi:hypothetical protein
LPLGAFRAGPQTPSLRHTDSKTADRRNPHAIEIIYLYQYLIKKRRPARAAAEGCFCRSAADFA